MKIHKSNQKYYDILLHLPLIVLRSCSDCTALCSELRPYCLELFLVLFLVTMWRRSLLATISVGVSRGRACWWNRERIRAENINENINASSSGCIIRFTFSFLKNVNWKLPHLSFHSIMLTLGHYDQLNFLWNMASSRFGAPYHTLHELLTKILTHCCAGLTQYL